MNAEMANIVATPKGGDFSIRTSLFEYADPYVNESRGEISSKLRELERIAEEFYGDRAGHARKRRGGIDLSNPATTLLLKWCPGLEHWLSLVPSAAALHQCYDPEALEYPTGEPVGEEVREWFRNMADPVGIRSRAAVVRQVLVRESLAISRPAIWLSLASGAAQPVVQSMQEVAAHRWPVPDVTLVDLDRSALRLASSYAGARGLGDHVQVLRANVLGRDGLGRLSGRLPGLPRATGWVDAFDVVDAVGILEYLKPEDWTYTYNGIVKTKKPFAGAITFLRNAFSCVRPGGVLVVGNMLTTHPQLSFTMNVVQWPHIQPRSVEEMLEIFSLAGLSGHIDIYLPNDGVYAVYVIRKAVAASTGTVKKGATTAG